MSYRPHPTKGHGHWYILVETKTLDDKGRSVRKQKYRAFAGSEAEAKAADAVLNDRPSELQYPSLFEIIPRFMAAYKNNTQPNTYLAMEQALKHLLPYYGEMRIPLIHNQHHEAYKTKRLSDTYLPGKHGQHQSDDTPEETLKRKPVTKSSINRELACLKSILTFAKGEKIEVSSVPVLFSKRQSAGKTILPLAPDEISALLSNLSGYKLTLAMLMFWGGLRRTEATTLQWEDVDLHNWIMMIRGKGGGVLPVPILGDLRNELQRIHKKGATGYICLNPETDKPYGCILKALRTAAQKAGITKAIDHHLLRHTCGTVLMMSGAQQRGVQGILRHASIETTSIYTHMAAQFLQAEGDKMSNLLKPVSMRSDEPKTSRSRSNKGRVICVTKNVTKAK